MALAQDEPGDVAAAEDAQGDDALGITQIAPTEPVPEVVMPSEDALVVTGPPRSAPTTGVSAASTSLGVSALERSLAAPAATPDPAITLAPERPDATSVPPEDVAPAPTADPLLGLVVAGRYRILAPIGRGGMGVVYKVEHVHLGKLLAMKLLTGELSTNPEVVRRFKREALTVSKLGSPSTVHVFDYGVDAGLTYIVMELCAGRDLAALLAAEGPMSFQRLGKIVIQILSSLAEAHGQGIVHRDVKPQNIMCSRTADGTDVAKVLDFGIAKLREETDAADVTRRDQLIGTPYFISPEQIRGDPIDHRADLYAVGVLMYHALTGHYPFNAKSSASILVKHVTETAPPPSSRAPERDISPGVDAIVLKALAKDPPLRWPSAEALREAIVDELRESGSARVEELLDARALERLTRAALEEATDRGPGAEIASRDEVEAYERKLRSKRHLAVAALAFALVATATAGLLALPGKSDRVATVESEPNDTAASASPLPLGVAISGMLGKRIDAQHSDRDFYAFAIPPGEPLRTVRLTVTGLPNMEMCTLLYRQGLPSSFAQYCVGRPGQDLSIPALRLEPGLYYASVLQDLDPRGERRVPYVHENVSDTYTIEIALADPPASVEIEPDDTPSAAIAMAPGEMRAGTIGWVDDQDFYCVTDAANGSAIRWTVRDALRDAGAVLEVAQMRGREAGPPLRLHTAGSGPLDPYDARAPWTSKPVPVPQDGAPRCLRVRLARDSWDHDAPRVPRGGIEPYEIGVEITP